MMKFTFLLLFAVFSQISIQAHEPTPGEVVLHLDSIAQVSCFEGNDGAVFISVLDGTAPFSFQWSNGDTTQHIANLTAGVYSVTVEDADGDIATLEGIQITQPAELNVSPVHVELPGCAGQAGSIEVAVEGGTPGYELTWNTGQNTTTIAELEPGFYELTATDANGCTTVFSLNLEPDYPTASLLADGNITCSHPVATLDGSASSQGEAFVFAWTAEDGGRFISPTNSLLVWVDAGGTYSLAIVNTLNGCATTATWELSVDTIPPVVDAGPDLEIPCSNSEVTLSGAGSTGPSFSHTWTAANGGQVIEGENTLSPLIKGAGTYVLTTTHLDSGCTNSDTMTVTSTVASPTLAVEGGVLTCLVQEIQLVATTNTADALFFWTGPNSFSSDEPSPVVTVPGEYLLTIVDTLTTCTAEAAAEVSDNTMPPSLEVIGGNLTCTNAEVTLAAVTGSEELVYAWSGPNGFGSNEQNPVVSEAGEYTLEATDTLTGCVAVAIATVGHDTLVPTADAGAGVTLSCAVPSALLDGSASSQGDDFAYLWTTEDGLLLSGQETLTPEVGSAGIYTLSVTNAANGCTASSQVVVDEDTTAPEVEATGGVITCFEPSIQLTGIFDTTHVSFAWEGPNGFTSDERNPVVNAGGNYLLVVTDTLNGCQGIATAAVIAYTDAPVLSLSTNDTITCSVTEATITVSAQLPDVVYSWSGPNGYQSGDSVITVSTPGIYTVLAIELTYGCVALDSITLEENLLPPTAVAGENLFLDCHLSSGFFDGTLSSQGSNFIYNWTTEQGNILSGDDTLTPEVDAEGLYTLTVTNTDNGCTSTDTAQVVQIAPVAVEISEAENVSCHGGADGSATVVATGGVGDFTYAWSSGSLDATAGGLIVGNYTVTVADGSNCTAEATVSIAQPDILTANAIATAQSLAGVDDGTATAYPTGGTPPYSFAWSNGETTQAISGLAPGAYTITMTDAKGCQAVETVNVNAFDCILGGAISTADASCAGSADGSAAIVLENAVAPLQFVWSNGDSLEVAANLSAGLYQVSITDSTNCAIVLTASISEPSPIVVSELSHTNLACPADQNGSVSLAANGGAQPYSFSWFDGTEGATINGLGLGDYEAFVTDGNGCELTYVVTISYDDSEPPTLLLSDLIVELDENGFTGLTAEMFDAGSFDNCGIEVWSVSPNHFDCSQTGVQTATVTATDAFGNTSSAEVSVMVLDTQSPVLLCPDDIVVSACNAEVFYTLPEVTDNCPVDEAQIQLTEGLPSGADFPTGITTQTYTYTDGSGNSGECSFTVEVLEALEATYVQSDISCTGSCDGSIQLVLSNGIAPYQILWSNSETGATLSGLCAGGYTATITDNSGCSLELSLEIAEPEALAIGILHVAGPDCPEDPTGEINAAAAGGVLPYEFLWSNGASSATADGLLPGIYTLVITDANGCSASLDVPVVATDTTPPVLILKDAVTVQLDENGSVTLESSLFDAGSQDNCAIAAWVFSPASFDCADLGTHAVTIIVTDSNGNAAFEVVQVTVEDKVAPTLTCPANILAGYCNPTVPFLLPAISDNCSPDPQHLLQTEGLPLGATFPTGITTQAFSYTDAGGNTATCSFTVTVATAVEATATVDNVTCFGACDGKITLAINGGTSPFSFAWSNGQTGSSATGLCAEAFSVSITDALSCLHVLTAEVTQPTPLQLLVGLVNNDLDGASQGDVFISVSGGTAPYTYQWLRNGQNFATTEDLVNIPAGEYTVTVRDANGCEILSTSITVENISGTTELAWADQLHLLPNPASDWVYLSFENAPTQEVDVAFLDAAGRLAGTAKIAAGQNNARLETAGLAPGFYTVQLRTSIGVVNKRLVVSRL